MSKQNNTEKRLDRRIRIGYKIFEFVMTFIQLGIVTSLMLSTEILIIRCITFSLILMIIASFIVSMVKDEIKKLKSELLDELKPKGDVES